MMVHIGFVMKNNFKIDLYHFLKMTIFPGWTFYKHEKTIIYMICYN